jgi:putative flippase GtrA
MAARNLKGGGWRVVSVRQHALRVIAFGATSGVGLAIDVILFVMLLRFGLSPSAASRLSSAAAVTFVYFASVRRIFEYEGRFAIGLFALYSAYQTLGVLLAAAGVGALSAAGLAPLSAKLLILPLTFPANYLAMSFITARKEARRV